MLDPLYKTYLLDNGVVDDDMYYLILDEIQKLDDFESVLNGVLHIRNLDIYVTGSNSKFLSSDIITELRGCGDEIRVYPLSFSEFYFSFEEDKNEAWEQYITYGGLPRILSFKSEIEKSNYLKQLFEKTYISNIVERNNIQRVDVLDSVINILASSIGSLTNPNRLFNTFESNGIKDISVNTLTSYIKYIQDAFLIEKAERYDIKGKKYIQTPYKFYFSDIGLRNCRLNFRE